MKRKMTSEIISIDHGSSLEVKFSAADTSYNTGWDWLMHPPTSSDGRETIGDCYGRAWGELKNGKKHGLTYLAHYSFQKGKCWHLRAKDKLVWTDGVCVSDNNLGLLRSVRPWETRGESQAVQDPPGRERGKREPHVRDLGRVQHVATRPGHQRARPVACRGCWHPGDHRRKGMNFLFGAWTSKKK